MEQDTDETRVVFRVFKGKDGGDVLALFPDIDAGWGRCESYQHVGQHGGADYTHCITRTRPARPEEYKALFEELENGFGYRLRVVAHR
jgi:hypothetical protein